MSNVLFISTESEELKTLYENHAAAYTGDAGIDLFCPTDVDIPVFGKQLIDLDIACVLMVNGQPSASFLMARSSITKTSLDLQNGVGLIDSGYRGHLKACFRYLPGPEMAEVWRQRTKGSSRSTCHITKGQRLCQLVAPNGQPIRIRVVDALPPSDRGTAGFGSSGTTQVSTTASNASAKRTTVAASTNTEQQPDHKRLCARIQALEGVVEKLVSVIKNADESEDEFGLWSEIRNIASDEASDAVSECRCRD